MKLSRFATATTIRNLLPRFHSTAAPRLSPASIRFATRLSANANSVNAHRTVAVIEHADTWTITRVNSLHNHVVHAARRKGRLREQTRPATMPSNRGRDSASKFDLQLFRASPRSNKDDYASELHLQLCRENADDYAS
jgi:hypothetical protein